MPGRDPRDHWDDEAAAARRDDDRGGPEPRGRRDAWRDPGQRAAYRDERGLSPQEREAIGRPYADHGRASGAYAPTAEQATGRERRSWDDRADPGAWFGRAPGEGPHRGRGPKGYSRSAERIREDVSDRLTDDPHLDASDIEVEVTGTEVTLNGHVDSRMAKRRAEDCAEDVTGVTHVQNNLRVHPRPGTVAAQTDPRLLAQAEGRDPDDVARELREDRAEADRSAHPPR